MPKILFFHGYGSSSTRSNTADMLRKEFGEENVVVPSYNYDDANLGYVQLHTIVMRELAKDPELMLVGTSLGGFWANHFCEKYNLKTVLINPCLEPLDSLLKYPGADVQSYTRYYMQDTPRKHKTIILGAKDEIIPYMNFYERLNKHYTIFIDKDMGHRITNPDLLIRCINESDLNIFSA
jgi:predicted esterase YcpF (UPF0227 family)